MEIQTLMNSTLLSKGVSRRKSSRKFSSSGKIIFASWIKKILKNPNNKNQTHTMKVKKGKNLGRY